MNVDVSKLWVSTWHAKGALHAQPMTDYIRDVNRAWTEGKTPEKWIIGVFQSLESALEKNRELKRTFRPHNSENKGELGT